MLTLFKYTIEDKKRIKEFNNDKEYSRRAR